MESRTKHYGEDSPEITGSFLYYDVTECYNYRMYITGELEDARHHIRNIDVLKTLTDKDRVDIFITSPGGFIDVSDMYVDAIHMCRGHVTTHGVGLVASAAVDILLAGDEILPHDGSKYMFHNLQISGHGDLSHVITRSTFYRDCQEDEHRSKMEKILTPEEMSRLFDNAGEVYLTAKELKLRLKNTNHIKQPRCVEGGVENELCDLFRITLEDGYSKEFSISSMGIRDFDEYNMAEIHEISDIFGTPIGGLQREDAILEIISDLRGDNWSWDEA